MPVQVCTTVRPRLEANVSAPLKISLSSPSLFKLASLKRDAVARGLWSRLSNPTPTEERIAKI